VIAAPRVLRKWGQIRAFFEKEYNGG